MLLGCESVETARFSPCGNISILYFWNFPRISFKEIPLTTFVESRLRTSHWRIVEKVSVIKDASAWIENTCLSPRNTHAWGGNLERALISSLDFVARWPLQLFLIAIPRSLIGFTRRHSGDFSLFRHATIYDRCARFTTKWMFFLYQGESQDDARDRAMFCELLYRSVLFRCSFCSTHFFALQVKRRRKKSARKATGKNRLYNLYATYDWINAKSNIKETYVNIPCWILELIKFTTGINTVHRIKYLFM